MSNSLDTEGELYYAGRMAEDGLYFSLCQGEVAAHTEEEASEIVKQHYSSATLIKVYECPNPFEEANV